MKLTTSIVPELVWYKCYTDCNIKSAILDSLIRAKDNTLSLPDIGNIKVNGNRLLGSYGKVIQNLRNEGYKIETKAYHHPKKKITVVTYQLLNPTFNSDGTNF